ncbi:MAG: hypothetical protein L6R41_002033 [Letrouitia leprolyta]|nr:MAG: hypothetical protein L6R41_002033 [Letrouitia leprolyta]
MLEVGRMDLFEDGAAQLMFKLEFSISLSTLEGYQSRPGCPSGRTARVDEVLIAKIRSDQAAAWKLGCNAPLIANPTPQLPKDNSAHFRALVTFCKDLQA